MMARRQFLNNSVFGMAAIVSSSVLASRSGAATQPAAVYKGTVMHSDSEWRKILTPEQYGVLRQEGTERAFSSPLLHQAQPGTFLCAGCDLALFASSTKFDSGTGWPSFWAPLKAAVHETQDHALFMERTAVNCARCNGHLGHVFDDGPKPTGLRYCMNGVALKFKAS